MYLLQRKSDGKFWKNDTVDGWDSLWADARWLKDPTKCKPFKTKGGAMGSRGVRSMYNFRKEHWQDFMKRAHLLFNVVEVEVSIKVK